MKIFPNEAFGYQRITVERPLRHRWEVTEDTMARLTGAKAWSKLSAEEREALSARLSRLEGTTTTDKGEVVKALRPLPTGIEKALWDALAVRDSEAPTVTSRKGEPEPDPDLRDNENVPLPTVPVAWADEVAERLTERAYRAAVEAHMASEVLPYVPDAWVDHDKTKIGYEIPLTRHFYKYVPPRPLAEIDTEIRILEAEIQELLHEVTE